ncbi:UBA THIF-type NAD FAD binding fold and Ubiquitin-activating enzyme repeat domain containing protein [Aphelenchoides bicaudatus]|nr:UBA THIF-type NAD FAD binding fold and Ubiquitin-activating enzyme repeat domain containing protein [Aphelenchoides bicaudatus]
MAGHAYFTSDILSQKLLVVGAGGIGCELLKNLAMAGFLDVEVIDLDTIDVSNLNRQFLFRKEHVGQPKAKVAADAARAMRPNMNIVYHHDSIFNSKYDVPYFQRFAVVLNALDNLAARRHVNRLCISSGIPLIDGGTTGFLGQVRVIKRNVTECFDCVDHPVPRTFPTCTIRNTPSEFIHCIVWGKFLFNQLFGDPDPDEDVAPTEEVAPTGQVAPTEQVENAMETNGSSAKNGEGNEKTISTRQFAAENNYDAQQMYNKLFVRDIEYLLSMEDLWKQRRPPVPFRIDDLTSLPQTSNESPLNSVWLLDRWISEFASTIQVLANRFEEESASNRVLTWDKDDDVALRFVAACANIRASIFHIPGKSLFDVKSMAGNIIPAIATSNAIVAGLMVVEAYKVVGKEDEKFQSSFISLKPTVRGKIVVNDATVKPNPKCYVCTNKREVFVKLNTSKMTLKILVNMVIKEGIGMIAPDVTDFGNGRIIASSEESENKAIENRTLADLSVVNGSQLDCDDYQQSFDFKLFIVHDDELGPDEYKIVLDSEQSSDNGHVKVFAEEEAKRKRTAGETDEEEPKRPRMENDA